MAEKNVNMKQDNAPAKEVKKIQEASDIRKTMALQSNTTQEVVFEPTNQNLENVSNSSEGEPLDELLNTLDKVELNKAKEAPSATIIQEENLDQLLEQEAAAAGLTGGQEGDGHSFVILDRINEQLNPVSYDFPINPTEAPETITGDGGVVQTEGAENNEEITVEPSDEEPPIVVPNTLIDDNEVIQGIFNNQISGNLLDNTEKQPGEVYSVTEFIIDGVTYSAGTGVTIEGVGNILIEQDGDWSFTPQEGYEGSIPVVTYRVFDGELYDNSTLTIGDIINNVNEVVLPTITVDLEVDLGAEKLVGNYTNADSIVITLTGDDGSSYELNGILNADNSWYADLSSLEFKEGVNYKAQATAQNNDGFAEAFDIDSYSIEYPPNTLSDDNEIVNGLFNATVSGNLLDNTEKQPGEVYTVTEFMVNGMAHAAGNSVEIKNVGSIFIDTNGDWSFTPQNGYEGSVPVVTYTVFDGELYDNSTLTITEIIGPTTPVMPTISIDLEVDPGLEKLVGLYTDADTIVINLTGSDGSSQTLNGVISSDGTWMADITSLTFNEDVTYTANAIATNIYGTASASDTDVYTIDEPPNTLIDGDETAIGLFNTTIGGNLLDNTERQVGENYVVSEFTINGITHQPNNSVLIDGVGTFTINSNGDWTFSPEHGYEGPVPDVNYKVYDGDLYDNSVLTISEISTRPYEYSFGNWFVAQSGNDSDQYFNLLEADKNRAIHEFEVQVQGHSDPIPDGAYIQVTFDITGTAIPEEDFNLSVNSKFYDVNYTIEDGQLIVNLSGGDGPLNGLPFSVTVEALGDADIKTDTLIMDIADVTLHLEDGRELTTGAWESNDSINFNIISPTTEVEATSNIDILGHTDAYGAEIFSWDAKALGSQQDMVLTFNQGDKLDFSDLLSTKNHQIDFDVTEVKDGTLVTITDISISDTNIQEVLLNNYYAADVSKMVNDLKTTGSYTG